MTHNLRKTAIATVALGVAIAAAAACGSSKKSSTPGGSPATKPDGTTPSNLACVGSNNDPAVGTSSVNFAITTVEQQISTTPVSAGVHVTMWDAVNATTSGGAAIVTDSAGNGILSSTNNTRVAWQLTKNSNYVPTYQFNYLTPATTDTTNAFTTRIITKTVYSAFVALAGFSDPTPVQGKTQFAAAVTDCDGDPVVHATVATIPRCSGQSSPLPCVVYFQGSAPNPNASETDASGQIVVIGLPALTSTEIHMNAVATAGQAAEDIGHVTVNAPGDSVGLAVTVPPPAGY